MYKSQMVSKGGQYSCNDEGNFKERKFLTARGGAFEKMERTGDIVRDKEKPADSEDTAYPRRRLLSFLS